MKRVRIVVAYDGTNYCGWRVQPNGITVEEVLNKKISAITGEDIHIIGASRTDSGVHAMGNVAVFRQKGLLIGLHPCRHTHLIGAAGQIGGVFQ